jgi:hypothetical protein
MPASKPTRHSTNRIVAHGTRVHTGDRIEPEWRRMVAELSRSGFLGGLGAGAALLAAEPVRGSGPADGRPGDETAGAA